MEMVWVRHGEPAWVVGGISRSDPELTDLGHEQARRVARRLVDEGRPIVDVVTSPAQRAMQTAAALAEIVSREPRVVEDLAELRQSFPEGISEAEVSALFAEARHRPVEEWWHGLGGESFRDFHERVRIAVLDLVDRHGLSPDPQRPHLWRKHPTAQEGRVVVFGHGGTNSVALTVLLGVEPTPWEWERFVLGHTAIARIRAIELAGAHTFSLRVFNDREHLPAELRTR